MRSGPSPHRAAHQFKRFLLVGLGNTAIRFVVYRLLLVLETPYPLSAVPGFVAGARDSALTFADRY
jgi:putative flippase GtrA